MVTDQQARDRAAGALCGLIFIVLAAALNGGTPPPDGTTSSGTVRKPHVVRRFYRDPDAAPVADASLEDASAPAVSDTTPAPTDAPAGPDEDQPAAPASADGEPPEGGADADKKTSAKPGEMDQRDGADGGARRVGAAVEGIFSTDEGQALTADDWRADPAAPPPATPGLTPLDTTATPAPPSAKINDRAAAIDALLSPHTRPATPAASAEADKPTAPVAPVASLGADAPDAVAAPVTAAATGGGLGAGVNGKGDARDNDGGGVGGRADDNTDRNSDGATDAKTTPGTVSAQPPSATPPPTAATAKAPAADATTPATIATEPPAAPKAVTAAKTVTATEPDRIVAPVAVADADTDGGAGGDEVKEAPAAGDGDVVAADVGEDGVAENHGAEKVDAGGEGRGGAALGGRPADWAAPLAIDGLPNLHRVSPALYRGAQPTAVGMRELAGLGVKTVVNLRSFHDDEDEVGKLPLDVIDIPLTTVTRPDTAKVARFLAIAADPARQPVFVHCQQGVDRTGLMVAAYRIAVEGWTNDEAVAEMTEGFAMHRRLYAHLVRYVRGLDADDLRRRAGLAGPAPLRETRG